MASRENQSSKKTKSIITVWKKEQRFTPSRSILGIDKYKKSVDVYTMRDYPLQETMEDIRDSIDIVDRDYKPVASFKCSRAYKENNVMFNFGSPFSPLITFAISITMLNG